MNANEIADELERLYQQDIIDGVADLSMPEAATMLRQQAKELDEAGHMIGVLREYISELKAKLQLHEAMDNQCASLMQQVRKAQEK